MWADRGCLKLSGMSTSAFRLEKIEGSLWSLVFDTPGEKVNKLNEPVMKELAGLLPELRKRGESGEIEALIFRSGKDGQFIAGADITMIQAAQSSEGSESAARTLSASGQGLMNEWEDLPFPTIAAVQGPALGGGCEWTLACSAILMSNDSATKIGLPEVMLGLLPGMGGCVRLPRKIGLAGALDMILSSRQIKAEQALKMGLIEGTVTAEQFLPGVIAWTKKNLEALKSGRRLAREPRLGGMGGRSQARRGRAKNWNGANGRPAVVHGRQWRHGHVGCRKRARREQRAPRVEPYLRECRGRSSSQGRARFGATLCRVEGWHTTVLQL